MSKIVRVARDNSAVIVKDGDVYSKVTSEGVVESSNVGLLSLLAGGSWRKPVSTDTVPKAPERELRLPKTLVETLSTLANSEAVSPGTRSRLGSVALSKTATPTDAAWINSVLVSLGLGSSVWSPKVLVSSGFELSDELDYFGAGENEDTEEITSLIAVTDDDTLLMWDGTQFNEIPETLDEYDMPFVIELDEDSATKIANWISAGAEGSFILDDIDDEEQALFDLASSEIDWSFYSLLEAVVADATGYSALERSRNAQRQRRGPGGTFAPGASANLTPKPKKNRSKLLSRWHRARLRFVLPLILDPETNISDWISSNPALWNMKSKRYGLGLTAAGEETPEPGQEGTPTTALYFAVVDPDDHEAVYDIIAIQADENGNAMAWKREGHQWIDAPDYLEDFRSVSPPPVVQLDDEETVRDVVAQIDQYDTENPPESVEDEAELSISEPTRTGYSLPDGGFVIEDEEDLVNAIESYEEAQMDDPEVRSHIRKRARALNRADLIPASWKESEATDLTTISAAASPLYGPYGEVYSLVASGVPGVADTPGDMAAVERLKHYWKYGKGAAKVRWGTPGDLTRCHRQLSKYMPGQAWGYCQELHKDLFGMTNYEKDQISGH